MNIKTNIIPPLEDHILRFYLKDFFKNDSDY